MASCAIQPLLDDAACFNTLMGHQLQVVQATLLCQILTTLNPVATCNVEELLADGRCFAALPSGLMPVVIAQLLCDLNSTLSGGGGGGGASGTSFSYWGTGSPEGVVTAPVGSQYLDISTSQQWGKTSGGSTAFGWT